MSYPSKRQLTQESIEDALALLSEIDDQRKVIRVQAWNQGDWARVFAEATAMKPKIERLRETLVAGWERWMKEQVT
jgi:hypothetical protein